MSQSTRHSVSAFLMLLPSVLCAQFFSPGIQFSGNRQTEFAEMLDLTPARSIKIPSQFSISFDISIWNPGKFGDVLLLKSASGDFLTLVFDCASSKDSAFFNLSFNSEPTSISLALPRSALHKGAWTKLSFVFDQDAKSVVGQIDNLAQVAGTYGFKKPITEASSFRFGPAEDPSMAVRDIVLAKLPVKVADDTLHFWRCCELDGDVVHDFTGEADGRQTGLTWLAQNHTRWKYRTIAVLRNFQPLLPRDSLIVSPQGFLDISRSAMILFDKANVTTVPLNEGSSTTEQSKGDWLAQVLIDTVKHRMYRLQKGGGKISTWDNQIHQWIPKRDLVDPDSLHYYSTRPFINPLNGDILLFGGYGWYHTYNTLLRFDFKSDKWQPVETRGDRISPRADPGICLADDSGEVYLFGGFGNESGEQRDEYHEIYDLWKLDLRSYTFTRLWEGGGTNLTWGSMAATRVPGDKRLFIVVRELKVPVPKAYLLQYTPGDNSVSAVGDTITGLGTDEIGFDGISREFVLNTGRQRGADSIEIMVGELAYPPLSESELRATISGISRRLGFWPRAVFVLGGFLALVAGFVLYYRRNRTLVPERDLQAALDPSIESKAASPEPVVRSRIKVFGGLDIFDMNGIERAKELSPKLRELFLLVLIHSTGNGRKEISTERLTVLLWPDSDKAAAKNSRGVTVNRLREFLGSVGAVTISYVGRTWKIELGDGFSCDYFEYEKQRRLIKQGADTERAGLLQELADIVKAGALLPDDSYEWLDPIKAEIANDTISLLTREFSLLDFERYPTQCLSIADAIARWDPLNEEALRHRIRMLMSLGHHGMAQAVFETFRSEYEKLYDEPFGESLNEFLSK